MASKVTAEQLKRSPREILEQVGRREEVLLRRQEAILEELLIVGHELGHVLPAFGPLREAEGIPEQLAAAAKLGWPVTLAFQAESSKPPQSLPTQGVIDKFLASRQPHIKPISLKSYELNLRTFARHYPMLPTKPEPIEQYEGRYSNENTGINNIDTVLRLLYEFASERLGLPNPMDKIKRPRGKAKPPQHLSISQAQALIADISNDRERGLIYCLLGLGLRLSEVRRLTVADIGEDTILIHGKERIEPMPLLPEIREALLKLTDGKCPGEPIFDGRGGKPLSDNMIQVVIKAMFQRAGITGVRASPHTLRHSRGVITDIAGLDDFSSRRLMRHADTEMTDRYSALNLEELRAKEEQYNPLRVLAKLAGQQLGKRPYFAQSDISEILPQLLEQMTALGQVAQEVSHALGGNGHRVEQIEEIRQYLKCQAGK